MGGGAVTRQSAQRHRPLREGHCVLSSPTAVCCTRLSAASGGTQAPLLPQVPHRPDRLHGTHTGTLTVWSRVSAVSQSTDPGLLCSPTGISRPLQDGRTCVLMGGVGWRRDVWVSPRTGPPTATCHPRSPVRLWFQKPRGQAGAQTLASLHGLPPHSKTPFSCLPLSHPGDEGRVYRGSPETIRAAAAQCRGACREGGPRPRLRRPPAGPVSPHLPALHADSGEGLPGADV